MDRLLPYLLIVILIAGGWNETFKSRFERLTGQSEEQPAEETAAEATTGTPIPNAAAAPIAASRLTSKPTPRYTPTPYPSSTPVVQQTGGAFFNDPSYRTNLDRPSKPTKTH